MRVQGKTHVAQKWATSDWWWQSCISKSFWMQNKIKCPHEMWSSTKLRRRYCPQRCHKHPSSPHLSHGNGPSSRIPQGWVQTTVWVSCTDDRVQYTGTQGPTHWYTHQENKYWWKGQGELYLHKQVGESRAPQMKQRNTVKPNHFI